MNIILRPPTAADVEPCGQILYGAFLGIAREHGFEPDFASVEMTKGLVNSLIRSPGTFGVVAEADDGRIVGSNFLHEENAVGGVGPISVDPTLQGAGIGRMLMQAVLDRAAGAPGVRLLQDAFNMRSMSLYASLGFDIREPLAVIQGRPKSVPVPGARPMTPADVPACRQLCLKVHGVDRSHELEHPSPYSRLWVVERGGRITAYATALHLWVMNHSVAETLEDMQALLLGYAASTTEPLGFILPTRQAALFRWCLSEGLRLVKPMSLMTKGFYQEPAGCWLPSVLY
jgi:predicted N-acetyltransferase YhbS